MFRNYFKIALRNIWKNKTFSFINVFGLAVGITCCMLIAVFVYDEVSYDQYPANAKKIYRLGINVTGGSGLDVYPSVDEGVGKGIATTYPEVKTFARLIKQGPTQVIVGDKKFKEQRVTFVDSNFLQLFSVKFIEGDPLTALSAPNEIVVTKALAEKYFDKTPALGKTMTVGRYDFKITGIIEPIPDKSHFHFDAFMSMSTLHLTAHTWSNVSFYTYVELNEGSDPKKLEAKFPDLVAKYVVPEVQHDMGVSLAEAQKSVNTFKFFLQPLSDIHLYGNTKYELEASGDISYVYIFSALAVFVLLLACVNFTNLSTASSAKRMREVGVRKVMGSVKRQLVSQFLVESISLTYLAILFSFILVCLLLPAFNQLSGKHIEPSFFFNVRSIASILAGGLLVGALAGIYPAFFLSSFKAVNILKSASVTSTGGNNLLRNGLVVLQFVVSTGLITATIIVYRQLNYMQSQKLGYDKEQVVFIEDTYLLGNRDIRSSFKQAVLLDSRVVNASTGTDLPGNGSMDGTQMYPMDKKNSESHTEIHTDIFHVDYDYIPTLGLKMVQGRNFSNEFSTDSFSVVINETAIRELGWKGTDVIGKSIVTSGQHEYKVIGVVADFHYTSLKQRISPLVIMLGRTGSGLIVKMKTTDLKPLLREIEKQWKSISPGAAFSYYFLDDKFASLYAAERKTGKIFTAFTALAIIIAGLGLFGLSAFIMQQRRKEIGVRKVLGASVADITGMLSKDFLKLVAIAVLIAFPLAWLGMNKWLNDFAYRTPVSWWIFAIAGITALLIALITVSFQAIKAAIMNPVKSLRAE